VLPEYQNTHKRIQNMLLPPAISDKGKGSSSTSKKDKI
jgi:hypothetical protein